MSNTNTAGSATPGSNTTATASDIDKSPNKDWRDDFEYNLPGKLFQPNSTEGARTIAIKHEWEEMRRSTRERPPSVTGRLTQKVASARRWGKLRLRSRHDNEQQDWWFAGTAIPLIAATIAPLANVLSIAALVDPWRVNLKDSNGNMLAELDGIPFHDPHWCYALNFASLICGYAGNLFLLANFTGRIRYIIALPATIILWYLSTGLLIGTTACMHIYTPPHEFQTYSQSFWYAVISSVLYFICSMILMVNMLGYFLGHYQEHFNLTEAQRTLILQTFLFFIWMAGGAGLFSRVESQYGTAGAWSYANALYFCDVTILTIGFGDLTPSDNVGRGFVLPYALGGIIMLGLMISSISSFARELSQDNIVKKRMDSKRQKTFDRTLTMEQSLRNDAANQSVQRHDWQHVQVSRPMNPRIITTSAAFDGGEAASANKEPPLNRGGIIQKAKRTGTLIFGAVGSHQDHNKHKPSRIHLLREEKERFDAMRRIQHENARFKKWVALSLSFFIFVLLWAVGAVIFWLVEKQVQEFSYFESLYFGYVSLLTIGYGDFTPKSSAGRPIFVVWSLLAIPSITILITDMSDTVVSSFQKATSSLADLTILPKYGIWRDFLNHHPGFKAWSSRLSERRAAKKRVRGGFQTGPEPVEDLEAGIHPVPAPTIDELAKEDADPPTKHELALRLAHCIKQTAIDVRIDRKKKYSYEEWVVFTQLIRFTSRHRRRSKVEEPDVEKGEEMEEEEEEEDLIEWDWIGDDSPMLADKTECEWLLDRLCESVARYAKSHSALDIPVESDLSREKSD